MKNFAYLACVAVLVIAGTASADERYFSADDVFALEYANDPRISPDGERIVYERRANDIMSDSTRSNLWLIDVDSGEQRPLRSGVVQASSPRWSPDGGRIAWLQEGNHGTGIHVTWLDTGETALLATVRKEPSSLAWSPDGESLAFVMPVAAEREPLVEPRTGPEGSEWSDPPKAIDSVVYRWDGQGFLEPAFSHIFVLPAIGGTPRQLTSGDFSHDGDLGWSADSERILFAANRNSDWEYEPVERNLWSVSVQSGELEQLTSRAGGEVSPVVSPDGRRIAYLYNNANRVPYRNSILHVMNTDGSGDRAVTQALDRSIGNVQWAGNSRSLYAQYDDQGLRKIARITLDGDVSDLVDDAGGTSIGRPYLSGSYTVSGEGTIAYTRGTPRQPADVAIHDGRAARVLTSLNDDLLPNRELGEVHELRYASSFDGTEIQGWYVTPPGYDPDKRYPLILEIHGGPHLAYGPQFSAEIQRFAAEGYVVFYDNHRGSSSYGEDFALLLQNKYSSPEDFADHMSGIDTLIERGIADPEQLYITGGSAGGIASAYAIGLTDRFRAAGIAKPVINWISKTLTADSYVYQIQYQFPGMPWEAFEHYWERSPLSLVGNVTTPVLLLTGEEDYRTPISETEQYYQALKLRRIDAMMVRIPGSSHGIAGRPSRLNAKVDNILAWFARYGGNTSE
ncbi:MAG: S9 family peptidase [Woeseia sp.]